MNNREDAMHPGRRRFLQTTALGAAALPVAMLGRTATATEAGTHAIKLPASILALQPVASQAVPIADDERRARLAKAQELMGRFGMDAIYLDGGTTLDYYTGMHWWTSERLMGMLLPKSGERSTSRPRSNAAARWSRSASATTCAPGRRTKTPMR